MPPYDAGINLQKRGIVTQSIPMGMPTYVNPSNYIPQNVYDWGQTDWGGGGTGGNNWGDFGGWNIGDTGGGGGGSWNDWNLGGGDTGGGGGGFIPQWLKDLATGAGLSWESVGEWFGNLINPGSGSASGGSKEEKAMALDQVFKASADLRSGFVIFLRTAGMIAKYVDQFLATPILDWPIFLIDLALFWLERGAPSSIAQAGFSESSSLIPPEFKGGGGTSTLPTFPGGGDFSLLAGTALMTPVAQAQTVTRYARAPKGYVAVTHPGTGQRLWVEKNLAYRAGLAKRRRKPPFTAKEWNSLKTAARVEEKMKRMSKSLRKYKCVNR